MYVLKFMPYRIRIQSVENKHTGIKEIIPVPFEHGESDGWPVLTNEENPNNALRAGAMNIKHIFDTVEDFRKASGVRIKIITADTKKEVAVYDIDYGTPICPKCGMYGEFAFSVDADEDSSTRLLFDREEQQIVTSEIKKVLQLHCSCCGYEGKSDEFIPHLDYVAYKPLGIRYISLREGPKK